MAANEHQFINVYRCDQCQHVWTDVWPATCNDDCPRCGRRHITPMISFDEQNLADLTQVAGDSHGVYLELTHGRNHLNDRLSDWGFDGPTLGPLRFLHTTYSDVVRIQFESVEAARSNGFDDMDQEFEIVGGLLNVQGRYYGDWSVVPKAGTPRPEQAC